MMWTRPLGDRAVFAAVDLHSRVSFCLVFVSLMRLSQFFIHVFDLSISRRINWYAPVSIRKGDLPCRKNAPCSGPDETSVRANPQARKRANLFVRKCITSVRVSTVLARPSRPSPLVYRRRAARASNCRRRPRAVCRKSPVAALFSRTRKDKADAVSNIAHDDQRPSAMCSNTKAAGRHRQNRSPCRLVPRPGIVPRQVDPLPPEKPPEPERGRADILEDRKDIWLWLLNHCKILSA